IDNNLVENSIRPVALGRKNYLFAGSHERAQDAAMLYSLFATCRLHNINPEKWLTHLFVNINKTPKENLHSLLPQNYPSHTEHQ
ncbi:MAG: transposase domain-containing protein, partial [Niabella sp.]